MVVVVVVMEEVSRCTARLFCRMNLSCREVSHSWMVVADEFQGRDLSQWIRFAHETCSKH